MKTEEILLSCGSYRAVVSPLGAGLRRLWKVTPSGMIEILWGYSESENKKGGQGDVLIPFPGRIPGGRYRFSGQDYQLELNDKEGPNAIHGFVRTRTWAARASESAAGFRLKLYAAEMAALGYPFSLDIGVSYQLSEQGLRCELSIQNTGDTPAPVAAGFHPYFRVSSDTIDSARLRLPATQVIEFAPGFVPTGRVLSAGDADLDFTSGRVIGEQVINHCLTGLLRDDEGIAECWLEDSTTGSRTRLQMSAAFTYLVVYTGEALGSDARQAIAIEPMTCGTDAFNRPEWGLKVLQPWEFLTGWWSVHHSSDQPDDSRR